MDAEDANRLADIELGIFGNIVKEVEKQTKHEWSGSLKENKLADERVASCIRNSFANYEKDRKADSPSYFKFK